jgi:hypothetical protein
VELVLDRRQLEEELRDDSLGLPYISAAGDGADLLDRLLHHNVLVITGGNSCQTQ